MQLKVDLGLNYGLFQQVLPQLQGDSVHLTGPYESSLRKTQGRVIHESTQARCFLGIDMLGKFDRSS